MDPARSSTYGLSGDISQNGPIKIGGYYNALRKKHEASKEFLLMVTLVMLVMLGQFPSVYGVNIVVFTKKCLYWCQLVPDFVIINLQDFNVNWDLDC